MEKFEIIIKTLFPLARGAELHCFKDNNFFLETRACHRYITYFVFTYAGAGNIFNANRRTSGSSIILQAEKTNGQS